MSISGTLNRITHAILDGSTKKFVEGQGECVALWVPLYAIRALNHSTGVSYGTSFGLSLGRPYNPTETAGAARTTVALHLFGGGTSTNGSSYGLFVGTGRI
jgi:hypothetical protein